jgi:hypothetical protein
VSADSNVAAGARHVIGVGLQALILSAIIATVALAMSAVYQPAGFVAGVDDAAAAKRASGRITVAEPVAHGETTTATVNPGGSDVYVFVSCYAPDMSGAYVFAAYYPVGSDDTASIGPLASSRWTSGRGSCVAEEGYFARNGLGKWVIQATDHFTVDP